MSEAVRQPSGSDLQIGFRRSPGKLRARVAGAGSLEATMACWRQILIEVRRMHPHSLLLVDELRGPALSAEEWHTLAEALAGQGLEGVRIAHVKSLGLESMEYCEIYAREAGLDARVFDNETTADLWLRHGER